MLPTPITGPLAKDDQLYLVANDPTTNNDLPRCVIVCVVVTANVDASTNPVPVQVSSPYHLDLNAVDRRYLSVTKEDARRIAWALNAHRSRDLLAKLTGGSTAFLPEGIAELDGVYASSNPLRMGEPRIVSLLDSSARKIPDKKPSTAPKILRAICTAYEDLGMLVDILFVLSYANDYVKKLVGKYMIVELVSIYDCLEKLAEIDQTYNSQLFQDFGKKLNRLHSPYNFRKIRNSIVAHRNVNIGLADFADFWRSVTRSNIFACLALFEEHLSKTFELFHSEKELVSARASRIPGLYELEDVENDYVPFDEYIADAASTDSAGQA